MNIEEYISSGVLEAYALGELSDEEREQVEKLIVTNQRVKEELSLIEESLETLAFKAAVLPGADLKEQIKQKVKAAGPARKTKQVNMSGKTASANLLKYAVAASVTLTLVTSYLAFNYWSKWKDTEERLSDLIAQNEQIASDYNLVNERLEGIESELEILGNPDFARVTMKGTDNSPESLATVYWNSSSQDVYLDIQNLKELSQERQYQLWAIVDGVPVDMGVFNRDEGLIKMKSTSAATAFAVTIEPRGGSENPSLETMQVLGATGD